VLASTGDAATSNRTPVDRRIDQSTSHAIVTIEESFSETRHDADGEPALQVDLPTSTTRVEVGFDHHGNQIVSQSPVHDPDPDLEGAIIQHVRVAGPIRTELDAAWQSLPDDPTDPELTLPPPLPNLNQGPSLVPYYEGQPVQTSYFSRATSALTPAVAATVMSPETLPSATTLHVLGPGYVRATRVQSAAVGSTTWQIEVDEERRLVGDAWRLDRHVARVDRRGPEGRAQSTYTLRYVDIFVRRDPVRDAAWAATQPQRLAYLASTSQSVLDFSVHGCYETNAPAYPIPQPPVCPPDPIPTPPYVPPTPPEFEDRPADGLGAKGFNRVAPQNAADGRPGILFVHGINSDAGMWLWAQDSLARTMVLPAMRGGSTNDKQVYDDQATTAASFVSLSPSNSFVAVGHSNGGVVSRIMMQRATPGLRGVVTVNTPHQGAGPALLGLERMLASLPAWQLTTAGVLGVRPGVQVLRSVIRGRFSALLPFSREGQVAAVLTGAEGIIEAFSNGVVMTDMAPRSARLASLNGTAEEFPRAGVWTVAPERMLAFRLWGEVNNDGDPSGGDKAVARYERRKRRGRRWGSLSVAIGVLTGYPTAIANGATLHTAAGLIGVVNRTWETVVRLEAPGPDLRSDGVVTASSQQYLGAQFNFFADGPTHQSTKRDGRTMVEVRRALVNVSALDCKPTFNRPECVR
jgi:pimeloyl-ACP methyl ester carboxylesterase